MPTNPTFLPPAISSGISIAAALLTATAGGCANELDVPSAYDQQRYLCGDDQRAEWQGLVGQCEAQAQCRGWLSFRGTMQGEAVTVISELEQTDITNGRTAPGELLRESLAVFGRSPYFQFRWTFDEIGGAIADSRARALTASLRSVAILEGALTDTLMRSSLRLSGGGASVDLAAHGGSFLTEVHGERGQRATLDMDFGAGNHLVGCFIARAGSVRTVPIP